MNTYTGMAIDAFRKQEQARRRLIKAEAAALEALKIARRVAPGEFDLYAAHTELIRFQEDRAVAAENRDDDAVEACDRLIARQREVIAKLEAKEG